MLGSQGRFGGGFRTDFHGVSFISRGIVNNGRYRFLVAGVDPTVRSARFQNADGTRAEHHQFDARPTFELAVLVLGPVTAWPHLLEVELANGEIVRQKVSYSFSGVHHLELGIV